MKGQSNLLVIALFFILIVGSVFAVVNMIDTGDFDMTYQINASVSDYDFQNDSWETENRDYQDMEENSQDQLVPLRNTAGFWISEPVNTTENFGVPQNLEYSADMTDGVGSITVRSFDQQPTGNADTETIDFETEEENSQNIQYVNGGLEVQ